MGKKKRSKKIGPSTTSHGGTSDAPADNTQLVPRNVLALILGFTSQPTVLSVAGVCRSWRAVAREHKFCYAYISLDGDDCETDDQFGCKGILFAQAIVNAEKLFERLSIRVVAPTFLDEDGGGGPPDPDNPDTDFLASVLIINTIALHLANVCKLDLTLPENCWEVISCLCDHTAPILEELSIVVDPDDDDDLAPFGALPDNLFASTAPLLHTVTLDGVEISAREPVRALSRARRVVLVKFRSDFLHAIAPNFPAVVDLDVDLSDAEWEELYPPFCTCTPLSSLGSHLRFLRVTILAHSPVLEVYFRRLLERRAIAYVRIAFARRPSDVQSGQRLQLDVAPLFVHVGKPFFARITDGTNTNGLEPGDAALTITTVRVLGLGSGFQRDFLAEHDAGLLDLILTDNLAPHIRQLEVALHLVPDVSRRLGALPRLRKLVLLVEDMTSMPIECLAAVGPWWKSCPALRCIDFGVPSSTSHFRASPATFNAMIAALSKAGATGSTDESGLFSLHVRHTGSATVTGGEDS